MLAPVVASAQRLWRLVAWASFRRRAAQPLLAPPRTDGRARSARRFRSARQPAPPAMRSGAYLDAIAGAREEIVLANAYFFRAALPPGADRRCAARRAGDPAAAGRVRSPDAGVCDARAVSIFLDAGIRLFEYHRSHLHAKVAVIDHQWATVGSSNIDAFSLLLARGQRLRGRSRFRGGTAREPGRRCAPARANSGVRTGGACPCCAAAELARLPARAPGDRHRRLRQRTELATTLARMPGACAASADQAAVLDLGAAVAHHLQGRRRRPCPAAAGAITELQPPRCWRPLRWPRPHRHHLRRRGTRRRCRSSPAPRAGWDSTSDQAPPRRPG